VEKEKERKLPKIRMPTCPSWNRWKIIHLFPCWLNCLTFPLSKSCALVQSSTRVSENVLPPFPPLPLPGNALLLCNLIFLLLLTPFAHFLLSSLASGSMNASLLARFSSGVVENFRSRISYLFTSANSQKGHWISTLPFELAQV
jgi:hypothetical protein